MLMELPEELIALLDIINYYVLRLFLCLSLFSTLIIPSLMTFSNWDSLLRWFYMTSSASLKYSIDRSYSFKNSCSTPKLYKAIDLVVYMFFL